MTPHAQEEKKPHVVILGGGFGGVYVASALIPHIRSGTCSVTLIDRTNYFLFTPLLHEVATGGLSPGSVAEPLRDIFAGTGVRVVQGIVEQVDVVSKTIHVAKHEIGFDILVVATGSKTSFRDVAGAQVHALDLKDLADAVAIRTRVIDQFESASCETNDDLRKSTLSFAVVGGGPTGVEIAGELAAFTKEIARRHRNCAGVNVSSDVSIHLFHAGAALLERFPARMREAARDRLSKSGVTVHFNSSIAEITKESVVLSSGTSVPASVVIWAGGVVPAIPPMNPLPPRDVSGRILVNECLEVQEMPGIFALGDVAAHRVTDGEPPLPMLAQVAVAQAKTVAQNVIAKISHKPLSAAPVVVRGTLVSVGQLFAVGSVFTFFVQGAFAWFVWRTVYFWKFASGARRMRIAFEWTLNLFYPRDITKLT